jgi:hypothetical protein
MPKAARRPSSGCLFAAVLLLLGAWPLWAQPAEPAPPPAAPAPAAGGANSEEKLPRSIREAYERAEKFGEEPSAQSKKTEAQPPSPWRDTVHYVGLGGGLLLLAALATGLWIYLVIAFRKGPHRVLLRRAWRRWHYGLGLAAGALALTHAIGRYVQAGDFEVEFGAPALTSAAIILLVISGIIRAWPPRALARHPRWWAWSHRVLTMLAVLALCWHGTTMYAKFVLHK